MPDLLLASNSAIRAQILRAAGLEIETEPARIDESSIRDAMLADGAGPRDIADALAETKALKLANKHPQARVLGCDQVLDFEGSILSKPEDRAEARAQLLRLRGKTHKLLSAAVLFENARPVWRHVATARLTMRPFTDTFLDSYLDRNWPAVASSVGGYRIEEEGVRLFSRIDGNHFTILGLPLLELLDHLSVKGAIAA